MTVQIPAHSRLHLIAVSPGFFYLGKKPVPETEISAKIKEKTAQPRRIKLRRLVQTQQFRKAVEDRRQVNLKAGSRPVLQIGKPLKQPRSSDAAASNHEAVGAESGEPV